jgi:site-specific DNA recombinase
MMLQYSSKPSVRTMLKMIVVFGCMAILGGRLGATPAHSDQETPFVPPIVGCAGLRCHSRRRRRRNPQQEASNTTEEDAASYSRFSSDQQRDESITDQQRKCNEAADRNGHRIRPEFEYTDEAVSGTKRRREGLDALLRDAEAGEFHILYFHSLSRLARESVITMPMLKRLVYVYKVRIISVSEGIDSARDNWEVIASIMSLLHERYIKELAENVFRGQEGAVLAKLCVGDYTFGYGSKPIPGSEATRRGRNPKPRKTYVIDETTAPWVLRIFNWFVKERRSLRWIARELNRRGAPKDHRSSTEDWHHQLVASVLANPKYIGIWPWGEMKNTRDPETGDIRQEPRSEEECEKWTRHFPHLRLVDGDAFETAQQLLQENYEKYAANRRSDGTFRRGGGGSADCTPRHLLSGLIVCAECGSKFHVGGSNGKYLFCPAYHRGTCGCQTTLRRDRAERMILHVIGERILANPVWASEVFAQTLKAWRERERQIPTELASAERALSDVESKIRRLVDRIENGYDDPDVKRRLDERRAERRDRVKQVERLKRANEVRGPEPTEEWVHEQLRHLGERLNGCTPAAAYALRDLVGGKIVVTEIRVPGRKRFHLQGRFSLCTQSVAAVMAEDCAIGNEDTHVSDDCLADEIVIDFVAPDPLDAQSEQAKQLEDQGLMHIEIADRLNCSKSKVTKLLHHWYEKRGLKKPDGRARRSKLKRKCSEPPLYQRISDEVKRLCDEDWLLGEIAGHFHCTAETITKARAYWYESRGLPVPDGRTRRKSLPRKTSGPPRPEVDDNNRRDSA